MSPRSLFFGLAYSMGMWAGLFLVALMVVGALR